MSDTTPEITQVLADATTRTHTDTPKEGLMTNTQLTENDQRAAYIDGLRQIADFLEENPDVELPHLASSSTGKYEDAMHIYLVDGDQKEKLATVARAMGRAEKVMDDDRVRVFRRFAGIALVAQASRDQVCERVVTGVNEVEVEERDPAAVAAAMATVPAVKVVKKVETVEWVCSPLLAAEKAGAVA